jgi:hypothetical protein
MREVDNKPLVQPPLVHYYAPVYARKTRFINCIANRNELQPSSSLPLRGWFARLTPP